MQNIDFNQDQNNKEKEKDKEKEMEKEKGDKNNLEINNKDIQRSNNRGGERNSSINPPDIQNKNYNIQMENSLFMDNYLNFPGKLENNKFNGYGSNNGNLSSLAQIDFIEQIKLLVKQYDFMLQLLIQVCIKISTFYFLKYLINLPKKY